MSINLKSTLNGLLLVDKPTGVTSHDVVAQARKILQTREVGHSGTLDPLATGLMVLLIGEATKLSSYVTDGDKTYRVSFKLGIETDTLDSTGEILKTSIVSSTALEVQQQALKMAGDLTLPVPMYSAKKIDGKKLYEYARENQQIAQPEKVMKFWDIAYVRSSSENVFEYDLSCSKGSFIRSWVSEIGNKLGCGATMTALRRIRSSRFSVDHAFSLEQLKGLTQQGQKPELIPLTEALNEIKKLKVKDMDLNLLKNGQISQNLRTHLIRVFDPNTDQFVRVHSERPENLVALIGIAPVKGFVIRRIFNS